jgi:flagellar protein FliT
MNTALLQYYEAIEQASEQMLEAARQGDWDQVVKLEGACALLISQLKNAAATAELGREERQLKGRIMKRILVNDGADPHAGRALARGPGRLMAGRPKMLH